MSEKLRVSVILTSFNHEKYLREAIDSVLNQTFTDFELIIWDDASSDESWNIIQSYKDSRIHAFRNEINKRNVINAALSANIRLGEYVAIHHSDDIWEPQKLKKQITFLDSNPHIGAVFTWASIINEEGNPFEDQTHFYYRIFEQPNRSRYEWLNYFFYTGNALCHPSILIRKSCYEECGLYRYGFAQLADFDMWVRLCLRYEIHVLPEKLIRFRVRANEMNTSGNRPETRVRSEFEYLQILYNYLKINVPSDFLRIFPKSAEYFKQSEYDISFALGMSALESSYNFSKLFGLNLLCEILNDEKKAQKVKNLYNFSNLNFIELTARYDIFSLIKVEDIVYQLTEQSRNVRALTIKLDELNSSNEQLASQLDKSNKENDQLEAEKYELQNHITSIYQSRSWRITFLFRKIGDLVRAIKSKME